MRRSRIVLSLLVLAVLGLNLVACGGAAPAPAPQPTSAPAQPAQPAQPVTAPTAAPQPTTPPTAPPAPNPLVIAMDFNDLVSLDPAIAFEISTPVILRPVYDSLAKTTLDDLNTYIPALAEKWDMSADGLVWTFHLRPNIKFASGNPLTGDDVKFSWNRLVNVKGSPSYYLDMVKDIEVVDPVTVKVTLKYPSPVFLSAVAAPTCGIMDSKLVKEHGGTDAADADKTDKAKDWLDGHSAGSGPYVMTSYVPKSEIVMEANPNYWGTKPKISKIIFKYLADPTSALQMLQKGDVDIVNSIDADLAGRAKEDKNLDVLGGLAMNMEYIAMTSNPALSKPLADKRVRQAVLLSLDYDGLIKSVLGGYAVRAPSLFPIGVIGVDPKMTQGTDLEKAKALLKEAGYEKGFTVDLAYGTTPVRDTVAAKIKSDLAKVGITANLKPLEMNVYFTEARAQKLAFLIGPFSTDRTDPTNWSDYLSFPESGVAFRMFYNNPEAARLGKLIGTEMDPVKRAQVSTDLQKVWMGDAWATMLFQQQQIVAVSKTIKGFVYHPFLFTDFTQLTK